MVVVLATLYVVKYNIGSPPSSRKNNSTAAAASTSTVRINFLLIGLLSLNKQ